MSSGWCLVHILKMCHYDQQGDGLYTLNTRQITKNKEKTINDHFNHQVTFLSFKNYMKHWTEL